MVDLAFDSLRTWFRTGAIPTRQARFLKMNWQYA